MLMTARWTRLVWYYSLGDKVVEQLRPIRRFQQSWRRVSDDLEQRPGRMDVEVWRFTVAQFDSGDSWERKGEGKKKNREQSRGRCYGFCAIYEFRDLMFLRPKPIPNFPSITYREKQKRG